MNGIAKNADFVKNAIMICGMQGVWRFESLLELTPIPMQCNLFAPAAVNGLAISRHLSACSLEIFSQVTNFRALTSKPLSLVTKTNELWSLCHSIATHCGLNLDWVICKATVLMSSLTLFQTMDAFDGISKIFHAVSKEGRNLPFVKN